MFKCVRRRQRMKAYRVAAGDANILWGARAVRIFERNSKIRFNPSNITHYSIVANAGEHLYFFHRMQRMFDKLAKRG